MEVILLPGYKMYIKLKCAAVRGAYLGTIRPDGTLDQTGSKIVPDIVAIANNIQVSDETTQKFHQLYRSR